MVSPGAGYSIRIVLDTQWDGYEVPDHEVVLAWDGCPVNDKIRSLLKIIENDAIRFRKIFLQSRRALCKSLFDTDHVGWCNSEKRKQLFWMSRLVEGGVNSEGMMTSLKLIALEQEIERTAPEQVIYCGENIVDQKAIKQICIERNVAFHWDAAKWKKARAILRQCLSRVARVLDAYKFLFIYPWRRWHLRKSGALASWAGGEATVTFFSYVQDACQTEEARNAGRAKYWGKLPKVLSDTGVETRWLNLWVPREKRDTGKTRKQRLKKDSSSKTPSEEEYYLESFLSMRIIVRTLFAAFVFQFLYFCFWKRRFDSVGISSHPTIWKAFQSDWEDSWIGAPLVQNLYWIELFGSALKALPQQKLGIYLLEGQSWERAMISQWQKQGHGKLIGTVHTLILFWTCRHFDDKNAGAGLDLPMPDVIAVNGRANWERLKELEQLTHRAKKCEALRYFHLMDQSMKTPSRQEITKGQRPAILMVGAYWDKENLEIVRMVKTALKNSGGLEGYRVFFKAHPAGELRADPKIWEGIENVAVLSKEAGNDYKFAVGPVMSVGLVDTYALGIRTIGIVHPHEMNLSPLKDMSAALFASSSNELSEIFRNYQDSPKFNAGPEEFFWLNEQLTRWREIIGEVLEVPIN